MGRRFVEKKGENSKWDGAFLLCEFEGRVAVAGFVWVRTERSLVLASFRFSSCVWGILMRGQRRSSR